MLGRHVRAALEKAGAQVIAVNRTDASGGKASAWDLADWRSPAELDALFSGAQAIVHAGAMVQTNTPIDEGRMFNVNVRACVNLGQWALSREVPVVHVSGSTVYADTASNDISEDAPSGWSGLGGFYGFSKLLAEDAVIRLRQQGLKLAVVRPSSVYGFGLPSTKMASSFLATAGKGETIELSPPVEDRVDLVHAADVTLAILAILKTEAWDTFNIASGRAVSIKELAEACVSEAGRGSVLINGEKAQARAPITRFALNTDRAKSRLGWRPTLDIKRGLEMMIQGRLCADDSSSVHH